MKTELMMTRKKIITIAILSIIIGSAFLIGLGILRLKNSYLGITHENIQYPHPIPPLISIPSSIVYFLFFGGIGLIIFGIYTIIRLRGKKL